MTTEIAARGVAQIEVRLKGQPLGRDIVQQLTSATVEQSAHLPDLAILEFSDPDLALFDHPSFDVGAELVVGLGGQAEGRELMRDVFDGDVTSIEARVDGDGIRSVVLSGYDRAHRLQRSRETRTFLKQSASDIANAIAREHGLRADVSSTRPVEWACQQNETSWEFLGRLARRQGFELRVQGETLLFKPPPSGAGDRVELDLLHDLLSFRARLTASEQVDEVEVRGWDPLRKEEIVGTASRANATRAIGERRAGGEVASKEFASARFVTTREHVSSVEEARAIAQAILDELDEAFVLAEGVAGGDPRLAVGSEVSVTGAGPRLSGKYVITSVRHLYEADGYRNEFEASGRRTTDLLSLVAPPAPSGLQLWHGIVTNVSDEVDRARVKAKVPVLGEAIETDWCRLIAPGAGPDRGIEFIPEVDDEVLLIGTDLGEMYVIGGLWNQADKPPEPTSKAVKGGAVTRRLIRSRTGHTVVLDDGDDSPGIALIDATGNRIEIATKENALTIKAAGDISITAGGRLVVEAGTDLQLKAGAGLSGEANAGLELQAQAAAKLAGASVEVSGQTAAQLSGGASAQVKAPSVNIGP